jgi:hypothetical protein
VAHPNYYDDTVPRKPKDITVVPFQGEHYQARLPDTLDLADYAERATNALTRLISPVETDYCIYHLLHREANPIVFEIGHGSNQNQNAKWSEAILLMRAMSGSENNLDGDRTLICSLTRLTGKDGLVYVPVMDRPWAFIDPVTEKRGEPYADIFGEARQLRAYAIWYQHDKNPLWKRLGNRKVDRLMQLAIRKGNTRWFKLARGYSPWYKETGEGPVAALGDVGQVFETMTGNAAANMICWMPHATATWYKVTGYEPALEFARSLAHYLYEDPEFYSRKTGRFETYDTFFTHCMDSLLSYALIANDKEIIDWVKLGAEQFFQLNDPNRTGVPAALLHPCMLGDMLQVACMLSRNGIANYWETIDLWIRNSAPIIQYNEDDVRAWNTRPLTLVGDPHNKLALRNLAYVTKGLRPYISDNTIPLNGPIPPELQQPKDANERALGACWGAGCCHGNYPRGVYLVWDSIMEANGNQLKVNLLMNRATVWADLDSYTPYGGKAVLKMKKAMENVLVRVPKWTDGSQVTCTVNGRHVEYRRADNGFVDLGSVEAGDNIVLGFPIKEQVIETKLELGRGRVLGTLTLDYIGLSGSQDDFKGRRAGKLDKPGTGNNDGKNGLAWRYNEGIANVPSLDGASALQMPIVGNWNTFIDTVGAPEPDVFSGRDTAFVVIFSKTEGGDIALGYVQDSTWDTGPSPSGQQRLFKIKANRVYIARLYGSDKTDEDTGSRIVPDKLQGLMIKVDSKGNIKYFYQDGSDRNISSPVWKDITPASSPSGNTSGFSLGSGYIGVNSLGEGTVLSRVTLKANTIVDVTPNIAGYPLERQQFNRGQLRMKTARRFATTERFVWD